MKNGVIKNCLFVITLCVACNLFGQDIPVYVSRQTKKSTEYNGNYAKQTDRYEQGKVDLIAYGPIVYSIDPNELTIQPNQNKNWKGKVSADIINMPEPGYSVAAQLLAKYNVQYSRPYGAGTNGTVLSTYYCSDNGSAAGNGGCPFHNNKPGAHEIVKDIGEKSIDFTVYSIKVTLADTICLGKKGQRDVTAVSFPAQGGNFKWTSSHPKVVIKNGDQRIANITLLDTSIKNAVVKVKFTIEGIAYETSGVLSNCECNCKPITTGIDAGPVHLSFDADPISLSADDKGLCSYATGNAAFLMTLDGGLLKRVANIKNGVKVQFGKNCESGELTNIAINWKGDIEVPELEIKGVKTFKLNVKEVGLMVDVGGNLSGGVKVKVSNTEDRDLTINKGFAILRKGTNADITFKFNNAKGWGGKFDFGGIKDIEIDLCKQNDKKEVILANYKGNLDADGVLAGDFKVNVNTSYKTNFFKVTLKELAIGCELKVTDATFRLTSGKGKVQLSEMKSITGTIDLGLDFPEAGGCVSTLGAADIKAFSMTLDELKLQANFDGNLDLTKVEGSLKAKHQKLDAKINIDQFKIDSGRLELFSCSGKIKYGVFKFTLEKGKYEQGTPAKLSIDAKVELAATGAAAMMEVQGFTIDETGAITVGTVKGEFNKPPATVKFSATFANNRFTGDFNGEFAGIGLEGAIDVGAETDPVEYNFAYLSITVKANVPLGSSGLKLTKIGGKVGYNYKLQGIEGPGNPLLGNYIVGLQLAVSDIGDLCEVKGEAMIQFNNGNTELTLAGTITVLKNNKFFEGKANVTYLIPAQTISGSIGAVIWIPGNGWVLKSRNLNINFFFGDKKFSADGKNMGGGLFGDVVKLSEGYFSLKGDLNDISAASGSLGGKASCNFSYTASLSLFGASIEGSVWLNMNSSIALSFDQNGFKGSFDVHVDGGGKIVIDAFFYNDTIQATASCDGSVNYDGSNLTMSGNITITLPFDVPFVGNSFTTGNVSVTL
jgi:hypothetical protein